MLNKKPYSILYICGNGHSGTTIMDIVLGSSSEHFSAGELTYITREGFFDEYCSCGILIKECQLWSVVFKEWIEQMDIEFSEYRVLRNKFEGNKALLRVFKNFFSPSRDWKAYSKATELFYDLMHSNTKAKVIIDSSKSATRLFLLNEFAEVKGLHVCRSFAGVLNSEKKDVHIDIKNGIESASPPKPTIKVLKAWIQTNFACTLVSLFYAVERVKFKRFISDPAVLRLFNPGLSDDLTKKYFKPDHMLAGNAIRLKPPQKLKKSSKIKHNRITNVQKIEAMLVDGIFWFWS